MANYSNTDKVIAQARLIGKHASNELRYRTPNVFLQFLRNSAIMLLGYTELLTREDRVIQASYRLRTSRALGNGRSHNHTGVKGDTGILTPSWTTKNDKFKISLKQADKNTLSMGEMLANEYENVMINWTEGLETIATSYLFTNRTQANIATQEGTFDGVSDSFQITESTHGERAVQITQSVMSDNKYSGNYTLLCDNVAFNKFKAQANQGVSNSLNTQYQFTDGNLTIVNAQELGALAIAITAGHTKGYWIAVPDGSISVMPWIPVQNRNGVATRLNTYSTAFNPILGVEMAMHEYESLADETANGGFTQDTIDQVEISLSYSFNHAPDSTANTTPIVAFAFV